MPDAPTIVTTGLPVIVCPLSRLGGEIAGETPSEIALNLAGGTRVALRFRCKPLRRCPDLRVVFAPFGAVLSPQAKDALRWVEQIYQGFSKKQEPNHEQPSNT